MSLLNFNFLMIYKIHKSLVLTKNHLNSFKDYLNAFLNVFLNAF